MRPRERLDGRRPRGEAIAPRGGAAAAAARRDAGAARARAPAPAPASDDDDVFDLTQTQATQETVAPDESDDDDVVDLCSPVPPLAPL